MQPGGKFIFLSSGSATIDQVPRGYEVTYGISKVCHYSYEAMSLSLRVIEWSELPGKSDLLCYSPIAKYHTGTFCPLRRARSHHLPTRSWMDSNVSTHSLSCYTCLPVDIITVIWEIDPQKTLAEKEGSRLEPSLTLPVRISEPSSGTLADASADGMIKVIDSATRESCGGKQMRL